MNNIEDVISWFNANRFIINPLITIAVVGGRFNGARILAMLIQFNKNDVKRIYTSKSQYLSYLRS